jgi:hypothetical protein
MFLACDMLYICIILLCGKRCGGRCEVGSVTGYASGDAEVVDVAIEIVTLKYISTNGVIHRCECSSVNGSG